MAKPGWVSSLNVALNAPGSGAPGETPVRLDAMQPQSEALAARLPPLMIEAERVAATVAPGIHGRRRVGTGESFWEFRRYRSEDPAQSIDWRQSAKTQNLFVREREWEAAESVWLWRDASPSMAYRSRWAPCSKVERATLLMLALASLLARGGERIAALNTVGPASHGRHGYNRVARAFTQPLPAGASSLPPRLPLPRFAQVVLAGDWLGDPAETAELLAHYSARGVRGHIIQVLDPAEEDLPFAGRTEFKDVESATRMIAGRAETLRDAYRRKLAEQRQEIAGQCRRRNWTFATHRTDRPAQAALLALYAAMTAHQPMGGGQARL
jgi:uncharacterized protein (DUF58 family)